MEDHDVVASSSVGIDPVGSYRSWLPRLTGKVMVDLRLWMMGFGLLIGVAFPFVMIPLGVPSDIALTPTFFAATLIAGVAVAEVNHLLARRVVGVRLRVLAIGMQRVEGSLLDAAFTGDWSACDPESCVVPVDSADELGELATSFNRLVEGLATSHRVSDSISALSEALAAHLALDALAESTLRELTARTGCEAAALVVVNNGRLDLAGSRGIRDADTLLTDDAVLATLRTAQPALLHLPPGMVVNGTLVDFAPQEVHVRPIRYGVLTVGVLVLAFARPTRPETEAVIRATLPSLAVAVNNALNHEDLQRVAALDPLTGTYNRRFGLQRLTEEFGRAQRSGDPLGLLMLDLDHFKSVNDTYGHLVGDRVLQTIVRATRQVLREGDVLLRYGGEEFLIVLPGAGRDDLAQMAERVRRSVAEAEITEAGQRLPVTVSVGGVAFPHDGATSTTDLISVSDVALYSAKESGRDRCIIA